ncbi:hypothetical protein ACEWPL_018845 [Roseovarius sp. S1116L3]|uniref:hypothetical protein n=1 Tax=Roseovarius roseus TaxID=3342636 RepID=UPI00372B3105
MGAIEILFPELSSWTAHCGRLSVILMLRCSFRIAAIHDKRSTFHKRLPTGRIFSSFFAAIGFYTDWREILSGALAPSR